MRPRKRRRGRKGFIRRASRSGPTPAVPALEWIEHRLREPSEIFAVLIGGFLVLDNRLHAPVTCSTKRRLGRGLSAILGRAFRLAREALEGEGMTRSIVMERVFSCI